MLGVAGGVVALTKRDLVDDETLAIAEQEVDERLEGTSLDDAPVVAVSSVTGEGVDDAARRARRDDRAGAAADGRRPCGCSSIACSRSRARAPW